MMMLDVTCSACGKTFIPTADDIRRGVWRRCRRATTGSQVSRVMQESVKPRGKHPMPTGTLHQITKSEAAAPDWDVASGAHDEKEAA